MLLPRGVTPSGRCAAADLEFRWEWTGEPTRWRLVLLDASLEVIWRGAPGAALSRPAAAVPARLLCPGRRLFWLVERAADGAPSSAPLPFRLAD